MFYFLTAVLTAFLDLLLKSGIEQIPDDDLPRTVSGTREKIQIRKVHNNGFPMGVLKERPEIVRLLPLAAASTVLLRFSALLPKKGHVLSKLGMSLTLGGAASNLFDRFFRRYVVDYLFVDVKGLNQIVFNLGDVCIALGGILAAAGNGTSEGRKSILQTWNRKPGINK